MRKLYAGNMNFIRVNLLLRLLIILNLICATSMLIFPKPSDGPQKSVICVVENGLNNIKELPPQCTSLASYTSDTKTGPSDIQALRKDLQYLLIIDDYKYETIFDYLTTGTMTEFIDKICDSITKYNANGVLFTRMNSDDPNKGGIGDPEGIFQQGVKKLFTELRKKHDDIVIGLCLTSVEEYLDHAFTSDFIGPVVDFFVADTVLINYCVYQNHQADMGNISPLEDIKNILDMMFKRKFSSDKLIFIIRVVVMSTKDVMAKHGDDTSYSDMCSADHKFDKKRKFCKETLSNFYQKGLLANNHTLKGVVVQSVDNDDYVPNCGPLKFPVMQAIKAGIDGKPEPKDVTGEPNWAILARDRN